MIFSGARHAAFRNADGSASSIVPTTKKCSFVRVHPEILRNQGTKAPEGASAGAGTGAVLGGGLGWLVGIGALAIPGLGPFVSAGPIVAAIAGAGVGGAVGGITGALIGMGIPEYEAKTVRRPRQRRRDPALRPLRVD